ncbi:hypothetical protein [Mucilaginibacter sp.]|uniref:hypothetical protein n=1 Tax=Mucilaginibacter sp. TaxID=1882438 RepID=UPI0025DBC9E3|nr:hypothetical protein [Mucilaginibacter sp.]
MKTVFSLLLISVILWGCSKKADVTPVKSTDTSKTAGPTNPISAKPDSTVKLTKDDTAHMAAFIIYAQKVKTNVSGKTLVMAFDENVNIFLLAEGYQKTSAIHLKEDWKKTALAAFDFTTVNQDGQTTFNSIDDNLNNVKFKTISDTTINGVPVKKVNVHRKLTFSKVYGSAQLATDQQNLLLAKTDELITFSSYTYYNQKNYPVTSAVAYVQYVK